MTKQDKNNITSIKYIATNIFSNITNTKCGLDSAMKMAPMLYYLYKDHINFNPQKPNWEKRDALFFSQGYAGPLLYSALHHFGYDLNINDLKNYGKFKSKTPQILDSKLTPGVEAITYPIGQDIGQAVGFALQQKFIHKKLEDNLLPHTFLMCAEEAMHSGKTMEAMSFAGHFKLNNLTIINTSLYSNIKNRFTTFSDNLELRAKSINWNFEEVSLKNDQDLKQFNKIIVKSKKSNKPTLINIKTFNKVNISLDDLMCPISDAQWKTLENEINPTNPKFKIVSYVKEDFKKIISKKINYYNKLQSKFLLENQNKIIFKKIFKTNRSELDLRKLFSIKLGQKYSTPIHNHYCEALDGLNKNKNQIDIRKELHKRLPSYIDGTSQILNSGIMQGYDLEFKNDYDKNIIYGVRDDSIASIVSGMSIANYMHPAWFTLLEWIDYPLASIRNQAIQHQNVLNIAHYSLNKTNPSPHQRMAEHIALFRAIPNLIEWKPCDIHEILLSYNRYLKASNHPTLILLPQSELTTISQVKEKDYAKGGYILKKEKTKTFLTVISSGYEMQYVYEAFKNLDNIRIVSMPSTSMFRRQSQNYKNKIIGNRNNAIFVDIGNDNTLYEFASKIIGINNDIYSTYVDNLKLTINKLKKIINEFKITK